MKAAPLVVEIVDRWQGNAVIGHATIVKATAHFYVTVEDAFGQFSDAAMLAVSEHPDALHLDREAIAA